MTNFKHKLLFTAPLATLVMVSTGCSTLTGPDYEAPEVSTPSHWLKNQNGRFSETFENQWWKSFNDPTLNQLIDLVHAQNYDVRTAAMRILEARAQLGISEGNFWPQQQSIGASATNNKLSKHTPNSSPAADSSFNSVGTSFDLSWELDFWGKFRRAIESADASMNASLADFDDVMVSLTAETARLYISLRTLETRLVNAQQNVTLQEENLKLAKARFEGGVTSELDVQQAASLLYQTRANIPTFEANIRQLKNSLAALVGEQPGRIDNLLAVKRHIPAAPKTITVGIPADLIRRRPDIRKAERRLAAQSALIGVAKADLYPHFSFVGSIGLSAGRSPVTAEGGSQLDDIFSSSALNSSFGPAFTWDILNYGRLKNNIRVEDARFEQLYSNYHQTVLNALAETHNALAGFAKEEATEAELKKAVDATARAVELAQTQYKAGVTDFQRVIDTLDQLEKVKDRLAASQGNVIINLITLYKSLGGGWQPENREATLLSRSKVMAERTDWDDYLPATEEAN